MCVDKSIRGLNVDYTTLKKDLAGGTKDWLACMCTVFSITVCTQPYLCTKCITKTNCNRMTTQAVSRSVLWWYLSSALNSCSCALCNILQGTVVPLMGKGQTRLWKSLFTASCLAVWSRSQQLLKWNKPHSHSLYFSFECLQPYKGTWGGNTDTLFWTPP